MEVWEKRVLMGRASVPGPAAPQSTACVRAALASGCGMLERVNPATVLALNRLNQWCRNRAELTRILVDNPAKLYGFTS